MVFRARMVNAERSVLRRDVVAECEVKLVFSVCDPGDRSDRIVRYSVCLSQDKCRLIRVTSPILKHMVCKRDETVRICAADAEDGKRPFDDSALDVLKTWNSERDLDGSLCHCKCIMAALEMVMGKYRSADDRQVRIGTQEVVRELPHKVKQLAEGCMVDCHRGMLKIERDAMLVVVSVRAVLKSPFGAVDDNRDNSVILSGRVCQRSGVAFVLAAEQACGILRGLCLACSGDGLGILFRLREVDRDIDITVVGRDLPAEIFFRAIAADIIRVLTEFIEPVGRLARGLGVEVPECLLDLGRTRHKAVHDAGVEEVAVTDTVFNQTACDGFVQKFGEGGLEINI